MIARRQRAGALLIAVIAVCFIGGLMVGLFFGVHSDLCGPRLVSAPRASQPALFWADNGVWR